MMVTGHASLPTSRPVPGRNGDMLVKASLRKLTSVRFGFDLMRLTKVQGMTLSESGRATPKDSLRRPL